MKSNNKQVTIIGLGYIGLPTAALIAQKGIKVLGMDINQSVVDNINKGEIHIVEPELDSVLKPGKGNYIAASINPSYKY